MTSTSVIVRRMQPTDIDAALALTRPQNWNQIVTDWERFLGLEPEGCFVAVLDGRVVATTTTERFGPVGWIGMVTTDPQHRSLGIGRRLMHAAISHLRGAGARTVKLDATPMGKPLYERLGFRPEYSLQRVVGQGRPLEADGVSPYRGETDLLEEILAIDRAAYGTNRGEMLRRLAEGWPEVAAVHRTSGQVDGFVLGRHGHFYEHLAPLVALNAQAAEGLLRWGITAAGHRKVAFDHPLPNQAAAAVAVRYGFEPAREFTRMHLGQEPYLDRPGFIFGTSGAEKG